MKREGINIFCKKAKISDVLFQNGVTNLYNFLVTVEKTDIELIAPSPIHGRSIIVDYDEHTKRYIITKGNGLTYFPYGFINTKEIKDGIWGFIDKESAIRDYLGSMFVDKLGIKTNKMEAVFSLQSQKIHNLSNYEYRKPYIVQYNVECPYRIHDLPFISNNTRDFFIKKWRTYTLESYEDYHCIAADIMLGNLRILHSNDVLHNAIDGQNYTLSLELLDFELTRTPVTPYDNKEDEESFTILKHREIIQTLEIVNYIAFFLNEKIKTELLKNILIKHGYGNLFSPNF